MFLAQFTATQFLSYSFVYLDSSALFTVNKAVFIDQFINPLVKARTKNDSSGKSRENT